jgi:hypothetical protein
VTTRTSWRTAHHAYLHYCSLDYQILHPCVYFTRAHKILQCGHTYTLLLVTYRNVNQQRHFHNIIQPNFFKSVLCTFYIKKEGEHVIPPQRQLRMVHENSDNRHGEPPNKANRDQRSPMKPLLGDVFETACRTSRPLPWRLSARTAPCPSQGGHQCQHASLIASPAMEAAYTEAHGGLTPLLKRSHAS